MGITEMAIKIKSSESFSKQPTLFNIAAQNCHNRLFQNYI